MIAQAAYPLFFLALCLAGGLGAAARFALDGAITSALARRKSERAPKAVHAPKAEGPALPVGTVVVNLSGSFLLGVLVGLVAAGALPPAVQLTAGVGFLGGYTTFSTASFQTVQLLREGRIGASALIGLGQLLAGVALAAAGLALGLLW